MEDETFDADLARKVQSSLANSASTYENQTQEKQWSYIMEESTKRSRRISRRTRLMSAAAAAAVIIAITGGVLVVANNSGTKEGIKTVDKKKKDPVATSTTTTVPLTNEQELLKDTYLVRATVVSAPPQTEGAASYEVITAMDILDGTSNKVLYSLPNDAGPDGSGFPVNLKINRVSGPEISVSRYAQCDVPFGFSTVNLASGKSTYTGFLERVYSPNGKKYIELDPTCDTAESIFVVDTKTNKKRELKPETIEGNQVSIANVIWIDDNKFAYSTRTLSTNPDVPSGSTNAYQIADLTKTVTIATDRKISTLKVDDQIRDIMQSGGKTYALVVLPADGPETLKAVDIDTGSILWSHVLQDGETLGSFFAFGNTPKRVVGSIYTNDGERAYIYDQSTDTTLHPNGVAVLPKR